MSAGHNLLGLVAAVQSALSANMEPDGPNDHETLATLVGLMDGPEQRAAEGQAQQDETDGELWRFLLRTIPEGTPENLIMHGLTDEFEAEPADQVEAFRSHLAKGLAMFKAAV